MKIGIVANFDKDGNLALNRPYIELAKLYGEPSVVVDSSLVTMYDWIWFPGGVDINPTLFNTSNYSSYAVNTTMDLFQIDCLKLAIKNNKRVLGICRGHQLIYYHLLLHKESTWFMQHVDRHNQSELSIPRADVFHSVLDAHGARLFVNSMHHQAIAFPEKQIPSFVNFYAPHDGKYSIAEGFRFELGKSLVESYQWHPEELGHLD